MAALLPPLRSLQGLVGDAATKLEGGVTVKLLVCHSAATAAPLVVHIADRVSVAKAKALSAHSWTHEKLMKPPRYSFIVRGDVSSKRVLRYLRDEGELGHQGSSLAETTLWFNWTYKGDGIFYGTYLYPERPVTQAADAMRGQRGLLQVSSYPPGHCPRAQKKNRKNKASRPRPAPLSRLEARPPPLYSHVFLVSSDARPSASCSISPTYMTHTTVQVVKHVFEAFINCSESYDEFSTHLGLILFSSKGPCVCGWLTA